MIRTQKIYSKPALAVLIFLLTACNTPSAVPEGGITREDFQILLQTLADEWQAGNAQKAVDCFTADAIYVDPPEKQINKGHKALYEYFGGDEGRAGQMKMTWHHLVFDESEQKGMGEFTFEYGSKAHGVTVIKIEQGKISHWREYWYESDLEWDAFTRQIPF